MTFPQAVVWMDHRHARIIDYALDESHVMKVRQHGGPRSLHHRAGAVGSGHVKDDHDYFEDIVSALGDATEVLIVGPGTATTTFVKDLEARRTAMAKKVVGIETLDHPSDGQLLAYAKRYFANVDSLRGG